LLKDFTTARSDRDWPHMDLSRLTLTVIVTHHTARGCIFALILYLDMILSIRLRLNDGLLEPMSVREISRRMLDQNTKFVF
jgi:hypothetical protein